MYWLFSRVPKGLEPVAAIFKKHVEGEGTKLVLQVTEALNTRKEKDAGARLHAWPAQHCAGFGLVNDRPVKGSKPAFGSMMMLEKQTEGAVGCRCRSGPIYGHISPQRAGVHSKVLL